MWSPFILTAALLGAAPAWGAPLEVRVHTDERGQTLQIDGVDTMLIGMNWGYVPVGENYSYDFWRQSPTFIERVLRKEMAMLQAMAAGS